MLYETNGHACIYMVADRIGVCTGIPYMTFRDIRCFGSVVYPDAISRESYYELTLIQNCFYIKVSFWS